MSRVYATATIHAQAWADPGQRRPFIERLERRVQEAGGDLATAVVETFRREDEHGIPDECRMPEDLVRVMLLADRR